MGIKMVIGGIEPPALRPILCLDDAVRSEERRPSGVFEPRAGRVNWRGSLPCAFSLRGEFLAEPLVTSKTVGVLHCAARFRAALFRMTNCCNLVLTA
jgi:hypothetical protein